MLGNNPQFAPELCALSNTAGDGAADANARMMDARLIEIV
jgi:hypothetical protein